MIKSVAFAAVAALSHATLCSRELTSPDQIDSLPTFEEGISSYLSRNMNQAVWDELGDKKDAYGFSFKQAIFSGCQNPDSGVGVYAGSPDTYSAFSSLFTPIIKQYHNQRGESIEHQSSMDYKELGTSIDLIGKFPEEAAEMIKSTRIRVARNI